MIISNFEFKSTWLTTTVRYLFYRNSILSRASSIPGYVAKHAEDMKFLEDRNSPSPIATTHGGPHVLVPLVIEDGERLGAHAQALLKALAMIELAKGTTPPFTRQTGWAFPCDVALEVGSEVASKALHVVESRLV